MTHFFCTTITVLNKDTAINLCASTCHLGPSSVPCTRPIWKSAWVLHTTAILFSSPQCDHHLYLSTMQCQLWYELQCPQPTTWPSIITMMPLYYRAMHFHHQAVGVKPIQYLLYHGVCHYCQTTLWICLCCTLQSCTTNHAMKPSNRATYLSLLVYPSSNFCTCLFCDHAQRSHESDPQHLMLQHMVPELPMMALGTPWWRSCIPYCVSQGSLHPLVLYCHDDFCWLVKMDLAGKFVALSSMVNNYIFPMKSYN